MNSACTIAVVLSTIALVTFAQDATTTIVANSTLKDQLYPQPNGQSALQQLQAQLANPLPFDLDETDLAHYKRLDPKWQDWESVKTLCGALAVKLLDHFPA